MSCLKHKDKKNKKNSKDKKENNDSKNERDRGKHSDQETNEKYHLVDDLDKNENSLNYQDQVLHTYQGYGMVSYPTNNRPSKPDYPRECPCMQGVMDYALDSRVRECPCTYSTMAYSPANSVGGCPCTHGPMEYPPVSHVGKRPVIHGRDGGDIDGTPTRCHLNLTIVNRGEFDAKRTNHQPSLDQFRQYAEEMKCYYYQQHAYLQEQNAQCFQQLLQMLQQQQQMGMPQEYKQNGFISSPSYPQTRYNNNHQDYPAPAPQQHPQVYSYPPPLNEGVLYEDVVNGTRITISESPPVANNTHLRKDDNTSSFVPRDETPSPVLQLNLTKSKGNERPDLFSQQDRPERMSDESQGRRMNSASLEEEPVPQINLYITVIPPSTSTAEKPSTSGPQQDPPKKKKYLC